MPEITITQVGPYPPPYGGVSTHILRLRCWLQRLGVDVPVWWRGVSGARESGVRVLSNLSRPMGYFTGSWDSLRKLPGQIVHFHRTSTYPLWAWASALRGQCVVITVHDSFSLETADLQEAIGRQAIRRLAGHPRCRFIAVNERICEQLGRLGVGSHQVAVIPAYLPSPEPVRVSDLPGPIREFGRQHRPLLSVYGIRCDTQSPWGDLYGLDAAVEALGHVRQRQAGAGLVVLTPGNEREPYLAELRRRAARLGVERHILWWTASLPDASPLWKFSDVYLRPTATDGDALAVREAISVGTPVVASGVVQRPPGTIVYRYGDANGLTATIETALAGGRPEARDDTNGFQRIVRVYSEVWPSPLMTDDGAALFDVQEGAAVAGRFDGSKP